MKLPPIKKIRYASASILSLFLDRVLGNITNNPQKRCYVIISPYLFKKYGDILLYDNNNRPIGSYERTPDGLIKIEWEDET